MAYKLLKKIQNFFYLLLMRYIYISELYMLEPFERVIYYMVFGILFISFWYFNYCIVTTLGNRSSRISEGW